MIIDVHIHIMRTGTSKAPLRWNDYSVPAEIPIQQMDYVGIDKGIVITNEQRFPDYLYFEGMLVDPNDTRCSMIETAISAIKKWPHRLYWMPMIHPFDKTKEGGEKAADLLEYRVKEHKAVGLKLLPSAGFWLDGIACKPILKKCSELNIPVMIDIGAPALTKTSHQLFQLKKVALEFPEINFIVPHLGEGKIGLEILTADKDDPPYPTSQPLFKMAKELDNVYLDSSGMDYIAGRTSPNEYPQPEVHSLFAYVIENVGPEKLLWGSDRTSTEGSRYATYKQELRLVTDSPCFMSLTPHEQSLILGANAARLFHIES